LIPRAGKTDYPLRARSHPAYRSKIEIASKGQRTNKTAPPRKTRRADEDLGSIRDEAAIIVLELKRDSMGEMSSLTDLLDGMGCAQYIDKKIAAAILGIVA